jgi:uncharacterized iron-regulated membrane protein
MKKLNLTRVVVFSIHSWLGLVTGLFLLLLGISGSGLVFLKEIDQTVHARLLTVKPTGKRLPLDSFYRTITRSYPHIKGIAWLNPGAAPDRAYEFRLYQNDGKISTYDLGMVSMDPYSGKVLRAGNLKDFNTGLLHWLLQFHWSFQLGLPGLLMAAVFGITMLISILTGLIVYRKYIWKVLTFRVGIKWKNRSTITSGLHRIVGVWALAFNLIIFFTGFWMNMFAFDQRYWQKQMTPCPANTLTKQSLESLLNQAYQKMPELIPLSVYLPTQPGSDFKVSGTLKEQNPLFQGGNSISFDAVTGQQTALKTIGEKSLWEKTELTFFPLHTGNFGGIIVKLLYVLIGLLPGLLSITGFMLWWRKQNFKYFSRRRKYP